jgi:hypothetical protein
MHTKHRQAEPNSIYNFHNWGEQLNDFIEQVIGQPAYISCNSVGGARAAAGRGAAALAAVQ